MASLENSEALESEQTTEGQMDLGSRRRRADKIVQKHTLYAMGAGLVPVPLLDIAAVTAVQIDMLRQLAAQYNVDYDHTKGKAFAAALVGSTFARIGASMAGSIFARVGASMLKSVPVVGTIFGGMSMSVLSGASTYAVGKVATDIFESGDDFLSADLDAARRAYQERFREARGVVAHLREETSQTQRRVPITGKPERAEREGCYHRRGLSRSKAKAAGQAVKTLSSRSRASDLGRLAKLAWSETRGWAVY